MSDRSHPEPSREDFQHALTEMNSYIDVTVQDLMHIDRRAREHAQLREAERLRVRDIMTTDVATVTPDTPLREAAAMLLELRISGLPVVGEAGGLVGVVTEADFLTAMGVPPHHPAHSLWHTLESMFRHRPDPASTPERVADIMEPDVITLTDDKTLHDVIDTMKRHHIKRVIITDHRHEVQGIVTRSNLIRVLLAQML